MWIFFQQLGKCINILRTGTVLNPNRKILEGRWLNFIAHSRLFCFVCVVVKSQHTPLPNTEIHIHSLVYIYKREFQSILYITRTIKSAIMRYTQPCMHEWSLLMYAAELPTSIAWFVELCLSEAFDLLLLSLLSLSWLPDSAADYRCSPLLNLISGKLTALQMRGCLKALLYSPGISIKIGRYVLAISCRMIQTAEQLRIWMTTGDSLMDVDVTASISFHHLHCTDTGLSVSQLRNCHSFHHGILHWTTAVNHWG